MPIATVPSRRTLEERSDAGTCKRCAVERIGISMRYSFGCYELVDQGCSSPPRSEIGDEWRSTIVTAAWLMIDLRIVAEHPTGRGSSVA